MDAEILFKHEGHKGNEGKCHEVESFSFVNTLCPLC